MMVPGWRMAAIAATAIAALAGCSATPPDGPGPSDSSTVSPSGSPATTPAPPLQFDPEGGATGNKDYFDQVMRELVQDESRPAGRAIIDHLVASGFEKADMEVTPDKTAVGLDVDAVQFSVRFGDECLVGQVGIQGFASILAPALATGRCLVGTTRSIDW